MGRRHVDQLLMLSQERFLSVPLGLWSQESYVCSITLQVPEYTLQNIPSVLNHSTLEFRDFSKRVPAVESLLDRRNFER